MSDDDPRIADNEVRREGAYKAGKRDDPDSLFGEIRAHEDTGHATNLMLWSGGIAAIAAATGYLAAFIHVATETSVSWDTLLALDGVVMAALFGGSGVLLFVFMLGIVLAHDIADAGGDDDA